jgi:thiamine biosynthesis lipoprotein
MKRRLRLAAMIAGTALLCAGCMDPQLEERSWTLQDGRTELQAEVYSATTHDAQLALEEIRRAVAEIEASMLGGRDAGGLGELNRAAAEDYYPVRDRDLYRCLLLALDYAKASEGAFDPTVGALLDLYESAQQGGRAPSAMAIEQVLQAVGWQNVGVADEPRAIRLRRPGMKLDLGGVAKGFALDTAARNFARPGSLGGLLRIGGNAYAWNPPPGQSHWMLSVPDPREGGAELLQVRVANRGVAVSGHSGPGETAADSMWGERLLLDPGTGRPAASDLLAAVAIADSAADADALATALFVAGSMRGAELLEKMRRVEAVLLVRGDEQGPYIMASGSLRDRLLLSPALATETGERIRYLLPPQSL